MEKEKKKTVPEYTQRAIKNYTEKKDKIYLFVEKGKKDIFKKQATEKGFCSLSAYIDYLIEKDK